MTTIISVAFLAKELRSRALISRWHQIITAISTTLFSPVWTNYLKHGKMPRSSEPQLARWKNLKEFHPNTPALCYISKSLGQYHNIARSICNNCCCLGLLSHSSVAIRLQGIHFPSLAVCFPYFASSSFEVSSGFLSRSFCFGILFISARQT